MALTCRSLTGQNKAYLSDARARAPAPLPGESLPMIPMSGFAVSCIEKPDMQCGKKSARAGDLTAPPPELGQQATRAGSRSAPATARHEQKGISATANKTRRHLCCQSAKVQRSKVHQATLASHPKFRPVPPLSRNTNRHGNASVSSLGVSQRLLTFGAPESH